MTPRHLIGFLVILLFLVCFAGFNLDNTSDISFGLFSFHGVPVFISLVTSFIIGAFVTIPFWILGRKERSEGRPQESGSRSSPRRPIRKGKQSVPDVAAGIHDDGTY